MNDVKLTIYITTQINDVKLTIYTTIQVSNVKLTTIPNPRGCSVKENHTNI